MFYIFVYSIYLIYFVYCVFLYFLHILYIHVPWYCRTVVLSYCRTVVLSTDHEKVQLMRKAFPASRKVGAPSNGTG